MTRYTLDTSDTHKYGEIMLRGENLEDYIIVGPKEGYEDEPNYAMAHLIAAAPDLYEALDRLVKTLDGADVQKNVYEALMASVLTLAKARGEA